MQADAWRHSYNVDSGPLPTAEVPDNHTLSWIANKPFSHWTPQGGHGSHVVAWLSDHVPAGQATHACMPCVGANVPREHAVHVPPAAGSIVPARHGTHDRTPVPLSIATAEPGGQRTHSVLETSGTVLLRVHGTHASPTSLTRPAAQGSQTSFAAEGCDPGSHDCEVVGLPSMKAVTCPTLGVWHERCPSFGWNVPGGHPRHEVELLSDAYVPASHGIQAVPRLFDRLPGAHGTQTRLSSATNPAGHASQGTLEFA